MSQKTKLEIIQEAMERVGRNPFEKMPKGYWPTYEEVQAKFGKDTIDLRKRPDGVWELPN